MRKQIDELKDNLEDFSEKNQMLSQRDDMANLLEKNNRLLIKTNEQLEDKIKEMRYNQDFIAKRFEEEMRIIKDKLEFYRINLNKVCATVYDGSSISIEN